MDVSESGECRKVGEMEIHHFSHPQHPLLFISDESFATEDDQVTETINCFGCDESLDDGSRYGCKECKYYLILLLLMDVSEFGESRKVGEMEIHHFSHPQHPLLFISDQSFATEDDQVTETDYYSGCDESLDDYEDEADRCFGCNEIFVEGGSRYGCKECKYYLHKECAELVLAPQIDHPFHPKHHLTLLPKSPYDGCTYLCKFCKESSWGFVYHCDPCKFDLHIKCALLQSSIVPNFPNSFHHHPLFFVQNHNDQVKLDCFKCKKPLSGPIYHCSVCSTSRIFFNLHKECGELPLEIKHPYDLKHPLRLLLNPPSHPHGCSCYLCIIQWKGFVYSCFLCNIHLTREDVFAPNPRTITNASHEHPWTLLSRHMPFICDFCGTSGDHTPYLCTTCDILVHKKCISMPQNIMITRHPHVISHSFSLRDDQFEDCMCRICHEEVIARYGSYYCARLNCNYIAHVHCATNKNIWDGKIIPDDYDDSSMEALCQPSNLITVVSEQMGEEEQMVAIEIKHDFHDHNLRLISSDEIKDDGIQCDGCMGPISTPFYSCDQCNFGLHKDCAELPKGKRHPFHKHLLMLFSKTKFESCFACHRGFDGFSYRCNHKDCGDVLGFATYDIRCIQLSDTLKHPSHEHSLFLVHDVQKKCSGCLRELYPWDMAYRCIKRCDFVLDINCATIPLEARYKYDRHPLTLTYSDDSSPSQHYCDLCENERDPKDWFYLCADCDNSLHSKCALAYPQFLKLGIKLSFETHRHSLTLVKNIWNCPPCKVCSNLCNGPALECKESECNFTVHWECCWSLDKY